MTEASQKTLLFLDDSGARNPDHVPQARADGMDWFALGGVLVDGEDERLAVELHRAFMDVWGLDNPLHSTRIRGRRNEFSWLGRDQVRAAKFYSELGELLRSMPVKGLACVIDRPGYNARYAEAYGDDRWLMCKTAYSILIERAAKHAQLAGRQLEIFFEQAGALEDRNLLEYHKALRINGMPFDQSRSAPYDGLRPADFDQILLGDPQRQTKANSLIQIADLYLYPMVKGGYQPEYPPYVELMDQKRIVDAAVTPEEIPSLGVKYSCFELINGERPDR